MLLDLLTIDEEGKTFDFDETSDELEGVFKDLIGETPFKIHMRVTPMAGSFLVEGQLNSHYPEVCSLCGYDIDVPLSNRINEIVVIEKQRPRNTQVSQSQQNFDGSGPSVIYLNQPELDLSEFLHEMMAAGFSNYPECADTTLCESRRVQPGDVNTPKGHPGFEALKGFKPKKH